MHDTALGYLHPHEVSGSFHESLVDLIGYDIAGPRLLAAKYQVQAASGGIPEGRNQLAGSLIADDKSIEWLFMVDADMGFSVDALARLREAADPVDRPIVGGLCFAQRETGSDGKGGFVTAARPTLYDYVEHPDGHSRFTGLNHFPVNALMRCAGTGGAFLLIHRSVLERIADRYGPTWFDRVAGTDGSLLGEDISFFVRCASLEIPLFVHTGIRTSHMKRVWLQESDWWAQRVAPPATTPVDVIVPVLHRPQNVRPFMESLRASTGLAEAWFVCEPDDTEEWIQVEKHGARLLIHPGTFAEKVNYAAGQTSAPWLFLSGDDVRFRAGWLDHCQEVAARYDAKVVGTNDLGNAAVMRGDHATHMLIDRSYVDEVGASWDGPGVVCHEGYRHWYVDNEIVTAAKQRGVWQMALGSIVEHLHPAWGKADNDSVYDLGQSFADKDRATFTKRVNQHAA